MSIEASIEYLSIGGNRQTVASSWSSSGLLAFGADQNVALWYPLTGDKFGIRYLLHGHKDQVSALSFLQNGPEVGDEAIVSGSAKGELSIHRVVDAKWQLVASAQAHQGTVNVIATLDGSNIFVTGGSNAEIKVWRFSENSLEPLMVVSPKPRLIPLALALGKFTSVESSDALFMVCGGTRSEVQVFALKSLSTEPIITQTAVLKGHEGWIRSLSLKQVNDQTLMLASASHDKYVRLWKFQSGDASQSQEMVDANQQIHFEQTLTAKTQTVSCRDSKYSITFEALLLGHEDWVYSAAWAPGNGVQRLLTASADGSLTIWEPDPSSGIWVSETRLGEISGQKGASTATGSAGGFWTGMWSPDGQAVTCLGRTGSWRLWQYREEQQYWVQTPGISGHTQTVNGLTWAANGAYLLSTSSDQTTRLHAEWRRDRKRTWHEFSRPQIHGYDLNCIASTGDYQFTSGADEKLLRVFNEPRDVAGMLRSLASIEEPTASDLPEMAAIPVLGLSNKAMGETDDFSIDNPHHNRDQDYIAPSILDTSLADIKEPPTEDLLSRHTLWPEHEKLYGHGYEISECAARRNGGVLATACKASSTDHAVIRLYDTQTWTEIKPSLTAHSLTVTRLAFSWLPSEYLLSVGRDRQWSVFQPAEEGNGWRLVQSNPKAHTRMILDCAWSPLGAHEFFATAGRDKCIKIWSRQGVGETSASGADTAGNDTNSTDAVANDPHFIEHLTIKRETAVTAIAMTCNCNEDVAVLAVGEENGQISVHFLSMDNSSHFVDLKKSLDISRDLCPSKAINRLAWRGNAPKYEADGTENKLAVAAADGSVRILAIDFEKMLEKPSASQKDVMA